MALVERQERRLVIAIDYGTTYTGVAIATPDRNRANLSEIDVIKDWGPGMGNLDKVPSVISYSPSSGAQERQWGASLSPEAVAMVHTKLQLEVHNTSEELDLILQALDGMGDLDFQHVQKAGGLPNYTWKGPEMIVEDYLTKMFDAFLPAIEEMAGLTEEVRAQMLTDIVVTIPAGWSYGAKNSIFRALTRAGFAKDTFPKLGETLVVSEPEAAAIYTARYLKERDGADFLKKGECFMLCDAGGGTVDVVSYRVKELQPTFEIEAITLATGYTCGSIFIDMAFKRWLKDLLGEENYRELDQGRLAHKISSHDTEGGRMRKLMKDFNIHKRKFKKDQRDIQMDLPEPLHNLAMDNRVVGGEITITYADMESFFQPCVASIIQLINGQVSQVERLHRRLKKIFLVGGFAESEYLQQSIEYSLGLRDIQLRRPDTSWTAVVRGAAIFGIEKPANNALSAMSACPQSYGVSVSASYSHIEHHSQDQVVDSLTKTAMAKEQLMWLIKKGDLILSDQPKVVRRWFTMNFPEQGPRRGMIPIYAYDDDDIPERLGNSKNELTVLHTLEYDLMDIPLQDFTCRRPPGATLPFYVASLSLTMRLGPQILQVELCWKERTLCSAEILCGDERLHINQNHAV